MKRVDCYLFEKKNWKFYVFEHKSQQAIVQRNSVLDLATIWRFGYTNSYLTLKIKHINNIET